MFGKFLKKLLSSIFFLVIFFLFMLVVAYVWGLIVKATNINPSNGWNYVLIIIATLLIELLAVYFIRLDNTDRKEAYQSIYKAGTNVPFSYDFLNTLISKDNILHTIAFNLTAMPAFLLIAIGNEFPVIAVVLGMIVLFLLGAILFAAISTCLWCIVHKRWLSTKPPKDFEKMWNAILNRLKGK